MMTEAPPMADLIERWRQLPASEAADAARGDQHRRWIAGQRVLVEEYLSALPMVASDPEQALVLIYGEVLARLARKEAPDLSEYQARFPQYRERLAMQFEVHGAMAAASAKQRTSEFGGNATVEETTGFLAHGSSGTANASVQLAPPGYQIVAKLGRGGMGLVYKAVQVSINRVVALKMILSGDYASEQELARFRQEAEAVAGLTHPHVVQLFEYGTHRNLPYFTLEFMEGGSLARKVKDTALSAIDAAALVEKLARGMAAAHARGIIHRDLKPENVLLASDGTPKIADFGLAKQIEMHGETALTGVTCADQRRPIADVGDSLTRTGAVIGTPSYMAPEQARGDKGIGPAADIWALGAIFYRLLTGRPPFLGDNPFETIKQVLETEPVAPRSLLPNLPRDAETICLKCLRKESDKRYTSADALAEDLRRWRSREPILARPVSRLERGFKWVRRNPLISALVAAIVLLLVGSISGIYVKYREAKDNETRASELAVERGRALDDRNTALGEKKTALELEEIANANLNYERALDKVKLAQAAYEACDPALANSYLDQIGKQFQQWEWSYLKRRCAGGIYTIAGFPGAVNGVTFSPDGTRIATVGAPSTVRVWNARTGAAILELKGHSKSVSCVVFSADGKRIATGCHDGTARVWDAQTGGTQLELTGHFKEASVNAVAFSPDGARIATAGNDAKTIIWDAKSGSRLRTIQGHLSVVTNVAYSPDGTWLATAGSDFTARIWHAVTGIPVAELKGVRGAVTSLAFSPDGARLVTGYQQGHGVKVWDVKGATVVLELKAHTGDVASVAFSPDGTRIASAGRDRTAKVWDARTGDLAVDLIGHTDDVTGVSFSPDGLQVATSSVDRTVKVWDAETGVPQLTLQGFIKCVAFDPKRNRLVTGGGIPTVWDAQNGSPLFQMRRHESVIASVTVSPDGTRIVSGGAANNPKQPRAIVWEAESGRMLFELKGHTHHVTSVGFSPDSSRIVTASNDKSARIWDAKSGVQLLELKGHEYAVLSAAFSPDGARIVTGGIDRPVLVWDANSGALLLKLIGHTEWTFRAIFNSNGDRIVTANMDKTARVWDSRTGAPLFTLRGHTGNVMSAAFSPDGTRIVTVSRDKTVRIWDAKTGTPLCVLKGHLADVECVAFSPDGQRFATTSADRTTRIWDAASGDAGEALDYRVYWTQARPAKHWDAFQKATAANDTFAARFQLERLVALLALEAAAQITVQ
jgi:WD40 repeat protein/serine/threonine protein kinase